ncbi:MAG: hypothetical protein AABY88_08650, partial [Pseudomonadota bacterium]
SVAANALLENSDAITTPESRKLFFLPCFIITSPFLSLHECRLQLSRKREADGTPTLVEVLFDFGLGCEFAEDGVNRCKAEIFPEDARHEQYLPRSQ